MLANRLSLINGLNYRKFGRYAGSSGGMFPTRNIHKVGKHQLASKCQLTRVPKQAALNLILEMSTSTSGPQAFCKVLK